MVYRKFIIEDDNLILGRVGYHKELCSNLLDLTKVKGGGLWSFDDEKTIILFDKSFQFGAVSIKDIKKCIELNQVFSNQYRTRKLENYTFYFRNDYGEKILISNQDEKLKR